MKAENSFQFVADVLKKVGVLGGTVTLPKDVPIVDDYLYAEDELWSVEFSLNYVGVPATVIENDHTITIAHGGHHLFPSMAKHLDELDERKYTVVHIDDYTSLEHAETVKNYLIELLNGWQCFVDFHQFNRGWFIALV